MPSSRRRWLIGAMAAALSGCLSPTMPMPPPSRPEIDGPDAQGVVVLSGRVPLGSMVTADNETTGYRFGKKSSSITGDYRFAIFASVGDSISLFYTYGGEDSSAYKFAVPDYTSRPAATGGASGAAGISGASGTGSSASGAGGNVGVSSVEETAGVTGYAENNGVAGGGTGSSAAH
jgi:hypothetical protein